MSACAPQSNKCAPGVKPASAQDPSHKPPRYRMRGGSVPRGATPGAAGHAGRMRIPLWFDGGVGPLRYATALAIVLLATLGAIGMPHTAFAATTNIGYNDAPSQEVYYLDSSGNRLHHIAMPSYFYDDGGTKYHCLEPHQDFSSGGHKSEDATKYYSQACITKLGMLNTWCKSTSNVPSNYANIVEQVLAWKILHENNYGRDGHTVDYVTVGYDSAGAYTRFNKWYNQNKSFYTGYGVVLTHTTTTGAQKVGRFWAKKTASKVTIRKSSTNAGITDGNGSYALEGARYGLYKDEACADYLGNAYDLTIEASGQSNVIVAPYGTYWIKELDAPRGYERDEVAHQVTLDADSHEFTFSDTPIVDAPTVWATKRDAQVGNAQGDATFAGAEFTVRYYDGSYTADTLPSSPTRTWVLRGDANGRVEPSDVAKVSGDEFYRNAEGAPVFPLGTVTIQETNAPAGYLLEGQRPNSPSNYTAPVHVAQITGSGSYAAIIADEFVMRGGVVLGKVSRETSDHVSQGEASLDGAVFSIVNESTTDVQVDGNTIAPGKEVTRISTDEFGIARTNEDLLPYGTYRVHEITPPQGYLPNEDWTQTFAIRESGQVVDLSDPSSSVDDQVMRGGFHFNKADEQTMERMAHTAFRLTSQTTGEWHVIFADENGIVDTETVAHSSHTNENDATAAEHDRVNEEAYNPDAGIWFSGREDRATAADDSMCALPYDTYTVEELRSKANEDRNLVSFTIRVHRHDQSVDMGTVDDSTDERLEPHIATTLAFDDREHVVPIASSVLLIDTVRYEQLESGETYTMVSTLVRKEDGETLIGSDGEPLRSSTEFIPQTSSGEINIEFQIDTTDLEGATIVAFEELQKDGETVCAHQDLEDEAQTVRVPRISTVLADQTEEGTIRDAGLMTLVDTVTYENLPAGRTFVLEGKLMDRDSGEPLLDDSGNVIMGNTSFVSDGDGTTTVTFRTQADNLLGKHAVAFEHLLRNGTNLVTHENLQDANQTVSVPRISTSFADEQGNKEVSAQQELTLIDEVRYEGLTPGTQYQLQGSLMDKETREALLDAQGSPVTNSLSFVPEESSGSVSLAFSLDTSTLGGKTIVAFEQLSCSQGEESTVVAQHEDWDADEQTAHIPSIETNATEKQHGTKDVDATKRVTIVDTVTYHNLTPGVTYTLCGTLRDKANGTELCDKKGEPLTCTKTFTPDEANGSVELSFTFDATLVRSRSIVVFESCLRDDHEVATHADLKDQNQTIYLVTAEERKAAKEQLVKDAAKSDRSPSPTTGDFSMSPQALAIVGVLALGAGVSRMAYRRTKH